MRDLRERRRITQWIDELRDELTALYLPEGRILVTSSVCVHMGADVHAAPGIATPKRSL